VRVLTYRVQTWSFIGFPKAQSAWNATAFKRGLTVSYSGKSSAVAKKTRTFSWKILRMSSHVSRSRHCVHIAWPSGKRIEDGSGYITTRYVLLPLRVSAHRRRGSDSSFSVVRPKSRMSVRSSAHRLIARILKPAAHDRPALRATSQHSPLFRFRQILSRYQAFFSVGPSNHDNLIASHCQRSGRLDSHSPPSNLPDYGCSAVALLFRARPDFRPVSIWTFPFPHRDTTHCGTPFPNHVSPRSHVTISINRFNSPESCHPGHMNR